MSPGDLSTGPALQDAAACLVLLHGKMADPAGMVALARIVAAPDMACIVPPAPGGRWYPQRFDTPMAANQPALDHAFGRIDACLDAAAACGIRPGSVALLGFSQGAFVALEYLRQRRRAVGLVLGFSGGLMGSDLGSGSEMPGQAILLSSSEGDSDVPVARVRETAALLAAAGAQVGLRIRPGDAHDIGLDEMRAARGLLRGLPRSGGGRSGQDGGGDHGTDGQGD